MSLASFATSNLFDDEDKMRINVVDLENSKLNNFINPIHLVIDAIQSFSVRTAIVHSELLLLGTTISVDARDYFIQRNVRHKKILEILDKLLVCLRSQGSGLGL